MVLGENRVMAKGNRNHKSIKPVQYGETAKMWSEEVKGYKAYAEERRSRRKWSQEALGDIYKGIIEYADNCRKNKEPMTIAGTMLATGTNKDVWYKARQGDMDYLLEEFVELNNISDNDIFLDDYNIPWCSFTDENTGEIREVILIYWSEVAKTRDLMIQEQLERNCYTNRGNPAGSIFSLKAQFNWREDETPQHLVQQLVIADLDQAKKALEMLK